jgi:dihydroorotase
VPPDLIIRNARVAMPDGTTWSADLTCRDGRIDEIDTLIDTNAGEEIDAGGHLLLPGVIDPQVHFRDPGATHKEDLASGSRAAVRGGVTSFLEMPNTRPATTTQAALDAKLKRASQVSVAHYGFFVGATARNVDSLETMGPACGIKVFMGSSTGDLLVDDPAVLERIFSAGRRLIAVHAEDEQRIRERTSLLLDDATEPEPALHSRIRDVECAMLATRRALELSTRYGRSLHVLHLSTAEEAELLGRDKPRQVTCEVIPNHLFLSTDDYERLGTLVQMNPPIRDTGNGDRLWQALRDGVIDIIATDHAPHTLEEKSLPYPRSPSGMPGVETSLPLMLTAMHDGRCTLAEILGWMCEGPARIYGIPGKGRLEPGRDADMTLVDMDSEVEVRNEDMFTRVRWSPFAGRRLRGWPLYTVVGGQVAFERGRIRESTRGRALVFDDRPR